MRYFGFLCILLSVMLNCMLALHEGAVASDGSASAEVLAGPSAITINYTRALNFGQFYAPPGPGTALILYSTNGNRTTASANNQILRGNSHQLGEIRLSDGSANQQLNFTSPENIQVRAADDGDAATSEEMTAYLLYNAGGDNNFHTNANIALNANGQLSLIVYGALEVHANQTPGAYQGTYNITLSQ